MLLTVQTTQSRIPIAMAARSTVWRDGEAVPATYRLFDEAAEIGHDITVRLSAGDAVTVEKIVTVYTGRDVATSEPAVDAQRWIARLGRFADLLDGHLTEWMHLWERLSIEFDDFTDELRILRLHLLHLLQTVSPNTADLDVGVPARGLHGEAYRGHIFWDELFIFPVLNLRLPMITRSLLGYRYRRLPEARHAAAAAGYAGAMFPWQSGSDGREESQRLHLNPRSGHWNPDASARAHHIGIAVAYNAWKFYQVTGDLAYLIDYGAELLAEIARFFVSLATYDEERERFGIRGVIGPDEFHSGYPDAPYDGIDNNAYTNVMAVWVIMRAIDALNLLPLPNRLDLMEALGLNSAELAHWEEVSRRMFVPFHDGVISQFEGYGDLAELDWDRLRRQYGNIQRLDRILEAEQDDVNRYKASKQADALMLLYLLSATELRELLDRLGYRFTPEQVPEMVDYYLARTSHGSTLSGVVHTWVLARANRDRAMEFFQQALKSDVSDIQGGTTSEGIHLAAMAGTVDLMQRCFTGLETRSNRIILSPHWPESLGVLAIPIHYRGLHLHLRVSGKGVIISVDPRDAAGIEVECRGRVVAADARNHRPIPRLMAGFEDVTPLPDLSQGHSRAGPVRERRPVYVDLMPPCNAGCPAGENIQAWLAHATAGRHEAAWRRLVEDNPFAAIHGRVCYHPCETVCNRANLDSAVSIHSVERFLGDLARERGWMFEPPSTRTGKRVLVVGAGPSGLSAAYHLARLGHEVEIRDAGAVPGGMMRYGIPSYRLPRDVLDDELNRIAAMGVRLTCDHRVEDLAAERDEGGFDAVFVAIGAHLAKRVDIPARDAGTMVDAVSFLRSVASGEKPVIGRRVAVYGGGDTAMDAARVARRLGAEDAVIVYRRTREQMAAHAEEAEDAEREGVRINWLRTITAFDGPELRVEVMELDDSGYPRPTGRFETLAADTLIMAIGQETESAFMRTLPGVEFDADGSVRVSASLMTGCPGVFAGGDMVPSERTVTVGVGHGKKAAHHIDAWLRGAPAERPAKHPTATFDALNLWYFGDAARRQQPELEPAERVESFAEVVGGLSAEAATYEAGRCLSCGNCFECDGCLGACPEDAVIKLGVGHRYEFDYDRCTGCAVCFDQCPVHAIEMFPEPT